MCGRFALYTEKTRLEQFLGLCSLTDFLPRFNIAPTQKTLFARMNTSGNFSLDHLFWGLLPAWAKDKSLAGKMINARSETISEKPSFKQAFIKRRGLVPANGFFEWKTIGKSKSPFFISSSEHPLIAFAAIWESNQQIQSQPVDTFSIITTEANSDMNKIHDRMPVILPKECWEVWLNHDLKDQDQLLKLLKPSAVGYLQIREVDILVNKVANDSPECLKAPVKNKSSK